MNCRSAAADWTGDLRDPLASAEACAWRSASAIDGASRLHPADHKTETRPTTVCAPPSSLSSKAQTGSVPTQVHPYRRRRAGPAIGEKRVSLRDRRATAFTIRRRCRRHPRCCAGAQVQRPDATRPIAEERASSCASGSRSHSCSRSSTAGERLGNQAITPAGDPRRALCHEGGRWGGRARAIASVVPRWSAFERHGFLSRGCGGQGAGLRMLVAGIVGAGRWWTVRDDLGVVGAA